MADRYWVGGTANWDGTAGTKWATTSGGAGGASVPTTADAVFFDASSGAGTATISTGNTGAASIDCTGFTGTITGSAAITVAGSVTLDAGMTYTHTGTVTFTGTGTLTTAGKTFSGVTVNGSGITLTLGDALNIAGRTVLITQGTFDTANYNITAGSLSFGGTSTRTVSFGSSTLTLSASNNPVNIPQNTNLTFDAGTSQINLTASNVPFPYTFGGGYQSYVFYNVAWVSTSILNVAINGSQTFNNLTLNASATGLSQLSISANQTVNGTFTCAGSSATARGFVRSDTIGTTRTITAATLSADDCDFRDITIAGGAAGTAPTRAGDCGGNSGITFPAAKTVYRVGTNTTWAGSSSWATTSGGAGSDDNFPLAQDTAVIDNNTTLTGTLALAIYNIGSLDASSRTTGITLNHNAAANRYGSYTLGSGVTVSGTSAQTFSGRGTMTFTSAGKTITFPITVDAPGGTFQLGDAFSSNFSTTGLQIDRGTFSAVTYNVTCQRFSSSNSNTRTINMGSGLWTLGGDATIWSLATSTGLTLNKDTANILTSGTSTATRIFNGGGQTFNKLTIGGASGGGLFDIVGANTFSELDSIRTSAYTIRFGGNQTIGTWSVKGTAGNVVSITSDSANTITLTKSGGGFLTGIDYLNVRLIIGSPVSDTWYIGSNSVYNTTAPNTARGFFLTQRADNAIVVLESTSSSTWTVPSDWNNSSNTIHLIGGGGGGAGSRVSGNDRAAGAGGGGGGYTQLTNQTLTVGASITYQAGSAGTRGTASSDGTAGGTTSWNSGAATAGGGGGGTGVTTPPSSTGGTAGTGSTYNGGVGGAGAFGTAASTGYGAGGGGGAAGPNGAGGNGGDGFGSTTGTNIAGGGGGGNGGGTNGGNASSATGGTGGNNSLGTGGGASATSGTVGGGGGGSVNSSASLGGIGIDIFGTGSGGGAGGSSINLSVGSYRGGRYGAGGGGGGVTVTGLTRGGDDGEQGAIIIVYTPGGAAPAATGNMFFMFN